MPVQLLGQPFVAFRDDAGVAHLLSDICVHRGGSLSAGSKVGNSVQCPYHGWRFGTDGVCTQIPAHSRQGASRCVPDAGALRLDLGVFR
ncbi:Rieske 2Fe-2S domain-containing protein [Pseudomonas sp. P108]|uniref:Rieske 2Fe-2S domain-containing protein n=1 Tax=Pseudomonas sp. P108 TaxID=1837993 RepID=UPI00293474F9|nr:Rieske 2Fe-2S domain-containing protein [Pseudomonas sp. P108]WNZ81536.1 Rieske 2Fe-2S domain-containing protein [Pseudomonas sp. P108]